jgi:hypothetical protein
MSRVLRLTKRRAAVAGIAICLMAPVAGAQESTGAEEDTSWQKMSARQLQKEYRDAEEAFYARFNEVNSSDNFDISCRTRVPLGSRKRERTCQAKFLWDYEEEVAEEFTRTGGSGIRKTSSSQLKAQQEEVRQEMSTAIEQHPEVGQAFARLAQAKRHYEAKLAE